MARPKNKLFGTKLGVWRNAENLGGGTFSWNTDWLYSDDPMTLIHANSKEIMSVCGLENRSNAALHAYVNLLIIGLTEEGRKKAAERIISGKEYKFEIVEVKKK